MAQDKEKLFKPEDFDKPNSSGNGIGWKKPLGILALVAALGGIAYGAYSLFDNGTDSQKNVNGVVEGITSGGTPSSEYSAIDKSNQADNQSVEQEGSSLKQDDSQKGAEQTVVNDAERPQERQAPDNDLGIQNDIKNSMEGSNSFDSSPAGKRSNVKKNNIAYSNRNSDVRTTSSTYSGNPTPTGTIKEEALEVIRGKYGTNPDRRRLLGNRYPEIQKKVNEMYKNRRFY